VHPVSPSDVIGLTMLICKTMMSFLEMREHVINSSKADGGDEGLDLQLTGPKFLPSAFITDIEVFAGLFSLTMPFPEPERVKCFEKNVDVFEFAKKIDSSRCEVDMQALVLYIDDFYTACRVTNSLCRCAWEAIGLCMRPEYGDFGSLLSDSPTSLFDELRRFKTISIAWVSSSTLRQPKDFLLWLTRLNELRKLFVRYLTAKEERLRGLVEMCRIAKEVEKDIEKLESEYNKYLDNQGEEVGVFQDCLRTWGFVGGRGPLFIHSVPLVDVYRAWTSGFVSKVKASLECGNSIVIALMESLKENGGVMPPELAKRRERFWKWQKEAKKDVKPMNVPIKDLLCAFKSGDEAEFVFDKQMAFINLHEAITERIAGCWLNSSLYGGYKCIADAQRVYEGCVAM
ncbi:hypothetical protein THOM_1180, partial [Trachipleistophora hominis]